MWGGGVPLAYGVQAAVDGGGAARRGPRDAHGAAPPVRNAAVLAAALLSTPYVLDYDFVMLGVAIAFLVADGARARLPALGGEPARLRLGRAAFSRAASPALTGVPIA